MASPSLKADAEEGPADDSAPAPSAERSPWPGRLADLLAIGGYLVLSVYLAGPIWLDPDRRAMKFTDGADELLLQWYLAHAAHVVTNLTSPFFTTQMNMPEGISLAGNASVMGLGIPLVPITLLFGAGVTTAVVISGSLAGTAAAWYWLLSRPLGLNRFAAAIGGLFAAFAPPLANESGFGHQHLVARFLVPIIVWRFIRLADGEHWVRRGLIFGAVLGYQAFINPETLLYTTISVMVFAAAYAAQRPREARVIAPRMIRGLAVGGATGLALIATSVYYQFFGPQHNGKPPMDAQAFHADVLDYVGWPVTSSLIDPSAVGRWTTQVYPVLGLPVVLVLVIFGWRLLRNPIFGSIVAVLAMTSLFSLGTVISLRHSHDASTYTDEGIPGPWRLVGRLPVFQWVVPERWGMMAAAVAGVVLAFILDDAVKRWRHGARLMPPVVIGLVLAACLTVAPKPFPTMQLSPIPQFITSGTWREYVAPGGSLVPVPASWDSEITGLRWAAASNGDIAIPGGYFLGPADGGKGTTFGVPDRWTVIMLKTVAFTGKVHPVQPADRELLLQDLRFWRASVLVVRPGQHNAAALRTTLDGFLGPAREVDDVWLWDVRPLM